MIVHIYSAEGYFFTGAQFLLHPGRINIYVAQTDLFDLLLLDEIPGHPLTHATGSA
jgi:hypothetical protein